jgi:nitrogen fixation protein NifQ
MAYLAAPDAPQPDFVLYQLLMQHAAEPHDPATLALAGVIAAAPTRPAGYRQAIRGLQASELQTLLNSLFPGLDAASEPRRDLTPGSPTDEPPHDPYDEFDDLTALLLAQRTKPARTGADCSVADDLVPDQLTVWVAYAVATACKSGNHLWQDLGLPSRDVLGALMQTYFAPLKAKNSGDMKWKKFFYRELCEQAEVPICKAPSCSVCVDQTICFGQEAGAGFFARASAAPTPA